MTRSSTASARPWGLLALGTLILGAALSGCVAAAVDVDSLSQVGPGDVLVAGRIELVPPLKPGEQQIKVLSPVTMENRAFVISAAKPEPLNDDLTMAQAQGYINAPFGQTFYVRKPAQPLYVNGVFFYLTMKSNGEQERVFLPAGFKVDIQRTDRAVYFGTIRYHRNEFFEVSKVEVVNDLAKVTADARKKFGSDPKFTARLPAKPSVEKASPEQSAKAKAKGSR